MARIKVNAGQRKNLTTLADFLDHNRAALAFDMAKYSATEAGTEIPPAGMIAPPCGSVGCAIGYGPLAGIKPHKYEDWLSYGDRNFGSSMELYLGLFSCGWARVDNTPSGAAKRIREFLATGYLQQSNGIVLQEAKPARSLKQEGN